VPGGKVFKAGLTGCMPRSLSALVIVSSGRAGSSDRIDHRQEPGRELVGGADLDLWLCP
jgi:hypothetical protein